MPTILAGLMLLVLLFAGCATDNGGSSTVYLSDTTYYHGPDTTDPIQPRGVDIISPPTGLNHVMTYRWEQWDSTRPCTWHYRSYDTLAVRAMIALDIPAGAASAQLLSRQGRYGSLYPAGQSFVPPADTFTVELFRQVGHSSSQLRDDTLTLDYAVQVMDSAGLRWTSQVLSFNYSEVLTPPVSTAPSTLEPDTLYEEHYDGNYGAVLVYRWCNTTPEIDYWLLHRRGAHDGVTRTDSLFYYSNNFGLQYYAPLTTYEVWIQAGNSFGLSPASEIRTVQTGEPPLPVMRAAQVTYPDREVLLWWDNYRRPDTLHVARRTAQIDWTVIASLPGRDYYSNAFIDTTTAPATEYFYRVGLWFPTGTWWSADSLSVRTQ